LRGGGVSGENQFKVVENWKEKSKENNFIAFKISQLTKKRTENEGENQLR
jgi:hypothetical protein